MNGDDEQLLDRLLDGVLSPEEEARANALLERDDAAVAWLARRAALHAALERSLTRRRLETRAIDAMDTAKITVFRPWWRHPAALATAALVMIGLMTWKMLMPSGTRGLEMEIVSAENAGADWQPGVRRLDSLALAQGRVKLKLPSDVTLDVQAPARVDFVDAMHVRLQAGKVTAGVGARGKGFTITTEQTRVVDLGTTFGVRAGSTTDVVVLKGLVELHDTAQPVFQLTKGEAVRVDAAGNLARIESVIHRDGWWSTEAAPEGCLFSAVTDNKPRAEETHAYYIVPGGVANGAEAYVNLPFFMENVPASLEGADLLQTIRGARKSARFELTVTLAQPAILYVMAHKEVEPPAWLADHWRRTGEELNLRSPDRGAHRRPVFEIWRREVPAGPVKLGPASEGARDGPPPLMYFLAARPRA